MKLDTKDALMVLLSLSFLGITLFVMPRIDEAQPDPYFQFRIMPVFYWVGLSITIIAILREVFLNKRENLRRVLGLFFVIMLSFYVFDIPRLFYQNPIYDDTYIFIGESYYAVHYGHTGWGHSLETPGLALFSSQLELITGISSISIAGIISLILPLLAILFIYVIAESLINKPTALLASLFYVSINWLGFDFNRQSFAIVIGMVVLYFICKFFLGKSTREFFLLVVVSYAALVVTHPVSSLVAIAMVLAIALMVPLIHFMRQRLLEMENGVEWKQSLRRALILTAIFSLIWLMWNTYTGVNLEIAISTLDETIRSIIGQRNVGEIISEILPSYTVAYYPIVLLRLFEMVFAAVVGAILALIILIKTDLYKNRLIVSSWFIGSMSIAIFGFYGGWLQLLFRPFLHASPAFSILLSLWLLSKKSKHLKNNRLSRITLKTVKITATTLMIIFLFSTPLTIFSHAPFMYPPTEYFTHVDFVVRHGSGTLTTFALGSEVGYFVLAYNVTSIKDVVEFNLSNSYRTIVTDYRAYIKDGFFVYEPTLTKAMTDLDILMKQPAIARVYDVDTWEKAYFNQSINPTVP